MIEIRHLTELLLVSLGILAADFVLAREEAQPRVYKSLWSCGPSLTPCRAPIAESVTTLPYWRGTSARSFRASYKPAFSRAKR